jgi:hypothetical protein
MCATVGGVASHGIRGGAGIQGRAWARRINHPRPNSVSSETEIAPEAKISVGRDGSLRPRAGLNVGRGGDLRSTVDLLRPSY